MGANGKKGGSNGKKKAAKKNAVKRDDVGKWLPGKEGGPGRPKCSLNWMTRFAEWAAENKTTPEKAALELIQKLWDMAMADDAVAMKLLVDRIFGAMDRSPLVAIQNNLEVKGPPVPEMQELGRNIVKLLELGREHGIVDGDGTGGS